MWNYPHVCGFNPILIPLQYHLVANTIINYNPIITSYKQPQYITIINHDTPSQDACSARHSDNSGTLACPPQSPLTRAVEPRHPSRLLHHRPARPRSLAGKSPMVMEVERENHRFINGDNLQATVDYQRVSLTNWLEQNSTHPFTLTPKARQKKSVMYGQWCLSNCPKKQ